MSNPITPDKPSESHDNRSELRSDLEELAISTRSSSKKGRHVTAVFDMPTLMKFIESHTQTATDTAVEHKAEEAEK